MTVSGKSVREAIRSKVQVIESENNELESQVARCENEIESLAQARESHYAELATFYLPEMDAASVKNTLQELRDDVQKIFKEKQQKRQRIEESMQKLTTSRKDLQEEVERFTQKLEQKAAERDSVKSVIAAELASNAKYQALHVPAQQAQQRLDQNKKRYEIFKGEAEQKLRAYESEKLFMYLVQRDFGTSRYENSGFIRTLDGWVARLVNFTKARRDYDFLKTMPSAIKEEIKHQQDELDAVVKKLAAIEDEASRKHGLQKILGDGEKLAKERTSFIERVHKIDDEDHHYIEERKQLDSTKDEYHREALGKLKSYLKGSTLVDLKERARKTQRPEDDELIQKIEHADSKIKSSKEKVKEGKAARDTQASKLNGLRDILRNYEERNYGSDRSYFDSDCNTNDLLLGYMLGNMSSHDINARLESHHHFKQREETETYSCSGSYSSSRSSSRSSDDDIGFGSSSFSSGGGFGGGGFSTGGGF